MIVAANLTDWVELADALAMPLVWFTGVVLTATFFFQVRDRLIPPYDSTRPEKRRSTKLRASGVEHTVEFLELPDPELGDGEWTEVDPAGSSGTPGALTADPAVGPEAGAAPIRVQHPEEIQRRTLKRRPWYLWWRR